MSLSLLMLPILGFVYGFGRSYPRRFSFFAVTSATANHNSQSPDGHLRRKIGVFVPSPQLAIGIFTGRYAQGTWTLGSRLQRPVNLVCVIFETRIFYVRVFNVRQSDFSGALDK